MAAIQLGIGHSIGKLSPKPRRDVLYEDFHIVEAIFFPRWVEFIKQLLCLIMSVSFIFLLTWEWTETNFWTDVCNTSWHWTEHCHAGWQTEAWFASPGLWHCRDCSFSKVTCDKLVWLSLAVICFIIHFCSAPIFFILKCVFLFVLFCYWIAAFRFHMHYKLPWIPRIKFAVDV